MLTKIHYTAYGEGLSMFPTLRAGNKILYEKYPASKLKTGDIILFKKNKKIICHRLLFKCTLKNKLFLFEKGDNPFYIISCVSPQAVIGKMIHPPKATIGIIILTIPGIVLGSLLFSVKKIFFKNTSWGIFKYISQITKVR